jgi:D-amino-acid dehydrogenase
VDDVIVIGGGIVGASAAYHLAREGVRATLIDGDDAGQATAAGAGIIAPGTTFRAPAAYYPLAFAAVAYYDALLAMLAEDGEAQTGFAVVGLLHVATTAEEATALPLLLRLIEERRAAGVAFLGDVSLVESDEARARFPALAPIHAAIYAPGAARVDGRLLRDALRRAAARRGARILTGRADITNASADSVEIAVNGERREAGGVILAGGAWSERAAAPLGLRLPVAPQRGQILHLELPEAETGAWPIVMGFHSHYLLAFAPHRVVAGATREDGVGFDPRATAAGVAEALGEALRLAPGLAAATLHEVRAGLRPASPDGLPLLGLAPGREHVVIATGHGANGLQLGPYSGALAADLVRGQAPALDLAPYAPGRFSLS